MPSSLRRLRKRPEFLRVAGARRSWVTPGVIVQARHRDSGQAKADQADAAPASAMDVTIGVGFTASRKVGSAVARNRAKRRLRALAAEILPAAGRPGHDYVLIARGGTLRRSYIELAGDLKTALARLASGAGARSGGKGRPGGRRRNGDKPSRGNRANRGDKRDREQA